jgi:DNA-binding XRE family transcriptional regulator
MLLLGILSTLPLGFAIGALVPRIQQVTTWGMLPIIGLAWISGVFGDMSGLWDWVQVLAQVFPLYWVGHLLRFAFLPAAAAAAELTGRWRVGLWIGVLTAWTVAGSIAATMLVRRITRRQSGAAVAQARDEVVTRMVRRVASGSEAVHNRIALLRAEQHVTRRELAEALGVHYQTIGYLERGEYSPSLHLALRIAAYFGVPVEAVFSIEPFPRISDQFHSA